MLDAIQVDLHHLSNPHDALFLQRYFKTAPGEYGEGDIFRGIRVPPLRALARKHRELPMEEAELLLNSRYHEDRLLALLILVLKYGKGTEAARTAIHDLYLDNTRHINNWDLVDCSAEHLVGAHLWERDHGLLHRLALSRSLWERRIAIMSTFHFIRKKSFDSTLLVAEQLLHDREDLIHKAVGWMLREVGKRDLCREEEFLALHYRQMPRTMLRYAIERLPEERRLG
ncbi:DNA alkylation repair protein [Geomonas sp. RF6]|uniref:DNA alkylation repair protein n=1 Tax=Geomonas sp. RF6 TaxID=2897342 RepID=UPI001E3C9CA5|nr:DNA alkylation repair protein [Geomonas sp. RF6]UFS68959.1 DNA alkylation repair protein [Geomonas sp. RF6]